MLGMVWRLHTGIKNKKKDSGKNTLCWILNAMPSCHFYLVDRNSGGALTNRLFVLTCSMCNSIIVLYCAVLHFYCSLFVMFRLHLQNGIQINGTININKCKKGYRHECTGTLNKRLYVQSKPFCFFFVIKTRNSMLETETAVI